MGVLFENHIRTYWWCGPARTGVASDALRSRSRDQRGLQSFCCSAWVRFWHKADIPIALLNVRFRG